MSAGHCCAAWRRGPPARADTERTGGLPIAHTSIVLLVILTASWFTDLVGIYSVFGAFVAGAVMPPRGALLDAIRERFEPLVAYLLLPAFFIYSGLNTQLTLIFDRSTLLMAGIVLVVSFAAKFAAVGLAARWQGMSWYEAGSMGGARQCPRPDGTHPAEHRLGSGGAHLRQALYHPGGDDDHHHVRRHTDAASVRTPIGKDGIEIRADGGGGTLRRGARGRLSLTVGSEQIRQLVVGRSQLTGDRIEDTLPHARAFHHRRIMARIALSREVCSHSMRSGSANQVIWLRYSITLMVSQSIGVPGRWIGSHKAFFVASSS